MSMSFLFSFHNPHVDPKRTPSRITSGGFRNIFP